MRLCMCEEIIIRFVCLFVCERESICISKLRVCMSGKVSKWMCV